MNNDYYSFKIFPRFWLIKTTCIIYHNWLLFTKIWKESSPYWINDVKSAARFRLLNRWRENDVKSAARCRLLNRWPRKPGDDIMLFLVSKKNKERNGETPLRTGKYCEWIIKQLLNLAFVGYEEFCRSQRVLSTLAFGLCGIIPSLFCRILHILLRLIQ